MNTRRGTLLRSEMAKKLDGMNENSKFPFSELEKNGLVIVIGESDGRLAIYGAITDECYIYGGGIIAINHDGIVRMSCDDCSYCGYYQKHENDAVEIRAHWSDAPDNYAWRIETDIPHTAFSITSEECDKWCMGIVLEIDDIRYETVSFEELSFGDVFYLIGTEIKNVKTGKHSFRINGDHRDTVFINSKDALVSLVWKAR